MRHTWYLFVCLYCPAVIDLSLILCREISSQITAIYYYITRSENNTEEKSRERPKCFFCGYFFLNIFASTIHVKVLIQKFALALSSANNMGPKVLRHFRHILDTFDLPCVHKASVCNTCCLRHDGSWTDKQSVCLFGIPWNSEQISQGTISCTDKWKKGMDILEAFLKMLLEDTCKEWMLCFLEVTFQTVCHWLPICCKVVVRKDQNKVTLRGKKSHNPSVIRCKV